MLSRLPPAILEEIPMRFPALSAFALALASIFTALATAQTTAPSSANWSYEGKTGPLVWGKLDPAYRACSKGHEQSPINIRGARLNTALQPIEFHYIAGPVTLVNDGRTIVAHVDPVSSIVARGVRYNLVEFSFHRPSEQAMRGKLSDMEVDLLHRSADGKLAVVAVRLTEDTGNANATLAALFADLPATAGASEKITEMVNPGGLIPADPGYWTYMGSLTTPPCTEGVSWFVFEQPVSISRAQFRAYASLFRMNTRGLQDPHGRRIEANE
jgi:carbonic anhydrase